MFVMGGVVWCRIGFALKSAHSPLFLVMNSAMVRLTVRGIFTFIVRAGYGFSCQGIGNTSANRDGPTSSYARLIRI